MSERSRKIQVGVLFGGRSGEHEVSLMSARAVLANLDREKYDVIEIGIDHDGTWYIGENAHEKFLQGSLEQSPTGAAAKAAQRGAALADHDARRATAHERKTRQMEIVNPGTT